MINLRLVGSYFLFIGLVFGLVFGLSLFNFSRQTNRGQYIVRDSTKGLLTASPTADGLVRVKIIKPANTPQKQSVGQLISSVGQLN